MKKICRYLTLLVLALTIACAFLLAGCGQSVYVTDVQTESTDNGTVVTYLYSDGSTKSYTVYNGEDGENGADGKDGSVTLDELYEKWLDENGLTDGTESYNLFLETYLSYDSSFDYSQTIQKTLLSAATVYCDYVKATTTGYRPGQYQTTYSTAVQSGSAFIWQIGSNYTYLVTNYHVVYCSGAATVTGQSDNLPMNIYCYLYGSEGTYTANGTDSTYGYTVYDYGEYAVECEYVGGSVTTDIAVVRAKTAELQAINPDIEEITLASDYYAGQTVYTVGNPLGYGFSVTQGIISVDNEYISLSIDGTSRYYRSIRTDAAIYSGNSGGGLFNTDGELVGITNAGATSYESLNYAVPLPIIEAVVENILDYKDGCVYKITLGVTVSTENTKYVYDSSLGYGKIREDVVINSVTSGSVAETLGLESGDMITALLIGETEYAVTRDFDISDALYRVRAGDSIRIVYTRGGSSATTEGYTIGKSDLVTVA